MSENGVMEGARETKRPIIVLQVIGEMELGGAESRIMDLTRRLDAERCHYDFLVFNPKEQHYDAELEALGCHIYRLQPRFRIYNYISYCRALRKFFRAHPEIDIVQGHMTSVASIYLSIAKRCGVRCTIAHARSAGTDPGLKGLLTRWLRRGLYRKADHCWACSEEAAATVYGETRLREGKVRILPNAIDLSHYYRPDAEESARKEELKKDHGLEGRFVVGHVGRFHYAKNHEFLLEIFRELRKKRSDAVLLLVGDGERMAYVRERAAELGLGESVIYTGAQSDPEPYYRMMDLLIFPSRYEGLPGTVVEAQAAGVPVLLSDCVTELVSVTPLTERYSLQRGAKEWAEEALALWERTREQKQQEEFLRECYERLCEKGFDAAAQARLLEGIYEELLECAG